MTDETSFTFTVRPLAQRPGGPDAFQRLKHWLKSGLRHYDLRVTDIRPATSSAPASDCLCDGSSSDQRPDTAPELDQREAFGDPKPPRGPGNAPRCHDEGTGIAKPGQTGKTRERGCKCESEKAHV